MATYKRNFRKTVWGFIEVEAIDQSEATKKFDDGDYAEYDNKSDYEFETEAWEED